MKAIQIDLPDEIQPGQNLVIHGLYDQSRDGQSGYPAHLCV
jgi:hypothetical protein